jgi:hypothetical protein
LHQFSLPTKSESRGSIALLSVVWLAIAVIGVGSLTRVTVELHERAVAQTNADSIALVAADYGDATAMRFALTLHTSVSSVDRDSNTVTVHVVQRGHHAIATALHTA